MSDLIASGIRAVNLELAKLPENVKGAVVTVADERGMRIGVVTKLGDGSWRISAELQQAWAKQRPGVSVTVTKTW